MNAGRLERESVVLKAVLQGGQCGTPVRDGEGLGSHLCLPV